MKFPISPCCCPKYATGSSPWQLQRKVIPPSKGHGSNDEKEKEINIGYDTQGKSLLNSLYLSWNIPLLFLSVRKSKKKIIVFPPSSQEDSFSKKKMPPLEIKVQKSLMSST